MELASTELIAASTEPLMKLHPETFAPDYLWSLCITCFWIRQTSSNIQETHLHIQLMMQLQMMMILLLLLLDTASETDANDDEDGDASMML